MKEWLIQLSVTHPYAIYAFIIVFACVEGPILSIIFGVLLHLGYFSLIPIFLALMFGDLLGDIVWYYIGRFVGHRFIRRFGSYFGITEEKVTQVSELFHRNKNPILIVSKITNGFGLALVTLVTAGIVHIPFKRYLALNMVGQLVWTTFLLALGYFFSQFFEVIENIFGKIAAFGTVAIAAVIVLGIYSVVKKKIIKAI